ncbi:ATP-binding cassette domain-containing protein [Ruminococcus sp. OA3]|uniref:ABC transporter ATP-binding protein n=1 Tax=Ruminococcus sp. OA3 TaxID=2914164 RepID=UPI001F053B75|nr:ATP-binding cassette domain-containing protein [Ruminococcus sp. OA3]MCH1982237.1 ATP-binding cassette domain-containing protein [Ruminococcus sp. OA3]
MPLIEIKSLTKDYGNGRGIFDLDLSIEQGEVFGFVGTNGAGKSTTIRHLMGFLKPEKGYACIEGLNCWEQSAEIKKRVGYIPGEIAFPDAPTGTEFLKRQAELLGLSDLSYAKNIIQKLQLDEAANLKRMSKGMKQKTAIVSAFMADPEILILDEPTTGLDPLMRAEFVDILNEQKKKGKTIFISSHMYEELEDTCDKVALIKDGKIIDVKSTMEIRHSQDKIYKVEFYSGRDYERFLSERFELNEKRDTQNQVLVKVNDTQINAFTNVLKDYSVKFISEIKFTLEDYFKSLM